MNRDRPLTLKLSDLLFDEFSADARSKGWSYLRRVQITQSAPTYVRAQVRGSQLYSTSIAYSDSALHLECTCPAFSDRGPCKHLWAVVQISDARGYLRAIPDLDVAGLERTPVQSAADDFSLERAARLQGRPEWERMLGEITTAPPGTKLDAWPPGRQILYVVDSSLGAERGIHLTLYTRDAKRDGGWTKPKAWSCQMGDNPAPAAPQEDREILAMMGGAGSLFGLYSSMSEFRLPASLSAMVVPRMAKTGRLYLKDGLRPGDMMPIAWDERGPWEARLEMMPDKGGAWVLRGSLRRNNSRLPPGVALLVTPDLVFTRTHVAPIGQGAPFRWAGFLRRNSSLLIPAADADRLLSSLVETVGLSWIDLPETFKLSEVHAQPQPGVEITRFRRKAWGTSEALGADLYFSYEGRRVDSDDPKRALLHLEQQRVVMRNAEAEAAAISLMNELGFRVVRESSSPQGAPQFQLAHQKLPAAVRRMVAEGWKVAAEGKLFRSPGRSRMEVASGIDWFELKGEVDYDGATASLPALLAALKRKDGLVELGDGTYGLLPEDWLARFAPLAAMGDVTDEHVRFTRTQTALLDALLATQPDVQVDDVFARARDQIKQFQGVQAAPQPEGFQGTLRDYQREGLGWFDFLRSFGFGGCLADDMGVGKTAQVLALLENRRVEGHPPSLVVVPRSLIFNWKQEAERFTPHLRVLDYTGAARKDLSFDGCHLILTTYGTLRRDVVDFQNFEFDYLILDEAQAIKNAATGAAKAVRLLKGQHRLALSGTPVENHLGELWSLFEFLNPGMLGSASTFQSTGGVTRNPPPELRDTLARSLRPFLLRRTKQQVARELPPKTEQVIHCEMEPAQQKLYEDLRKHYRQSLLSKVEDLGLGKTRMHVLEALLRLRQAACHPGLLDATKVGEPSAKLDMLFDQLDEVLENGHKALIFSQFTSFLAILRKELDKRKVVYEYLDGATRDRKERVERFQTDKKCPLFLLSLKAGGLGLNLTAADYVFLLDPWWNPAVEAQAVDRTHRIGQSRHVFAYRLIARGTVEEKVLELQNSKRDLAGAIMTEDNSVLRNLKQEDLELLLS